MPKTLLEKIVFTIVMAAIMVYGMIVYNVALNTGAGIFRGGKAGDPAGLHLYAADGPAAVHHLRHLADDRLHHVPHHEPCGDRAVQGAELRHVGAHLRLQLPDGPVLADVLLRPAGSLSLPAHLPPRETVSLL